VWVRVYSFVRCIMGPSSDRGGVNQSCFPPQPFLDMQKVEVRLMEMDLKLREIADLLRGRDKVNPVAAEEAVVPIQEGVSFPLQEQVSGLSARLFALEKAVFDLEARVADSNRQALGLRVSALEEKLGRVSQLAFQYLGD
jgi:hypothetical protein